MFRWKAEKQEDQTLVSVFMSSPIPLRLHRLKLLYSSLHHPPVGFLSIRGRLQTLPLRAVEGDWEKMGIDRKKRIRKVFDVFGRVQVTDWKREPSLMLTCNPNRATHLSEFFEAFGGSIHVNRYGKGVMAASLRWRVGGARARAIAQVLCWEESRKNRVLKIVAQWPALSLDSERKKAFSNLKKANRILKTRFVESGTVRSWKDMVDLFECFGSVIENRTTKQVTLMISHVSPSLISSVKSFLQSEGMLPSGSGGNIRRLNLWGRTQVPLIAFHAAQPTAALAERLLREGVVFKKHRLDAALAVLKKNIVGPREEEAPPLHLSNFSSRLRHSRHGESSLQLAILAKALYLRVHYAEKKRWKRDGDRDDRCREELSKCEIQRDIFRAQHAIGLLRADIRELLAKKNLYESSSVRPGVLEVKLEEEENMRHSTSTFSPNSRF